MTAILQIESATIVCAVNGKPFLARFIQPLKQRSQSLSNKDRGAETIITHGEQQ